jgi:hypothetical protein
MKDMKLQIVSLQNENKLQQLREQLLNWQEQINQVRMEKE